MEEQTFDRENTAQESSRRRAGSGFGLTMLRSPSPASPTDGGFTALLPYPLLSPAFGRAQKIP